MKYSPATLIVFGFLFLPVRVNAEVLAHFTHENPDKGFNTGFTLSSSQVEYKPQDFNGRATWQRKSAGLEFSTYISSGINLLAQVAYTFDATAKNTGKYRWDGKGYMLGSGLSFLSYRQQTLSIIGYGLLNYTSENYDVKNRSNLQTVSNVEADTAIVDFYIGAAVKFTTSKKLSPYLALEFVPYNDGKLKVRSKVDSVEVDMKREKDINLKIGVDLTNENFIFRPEVTFIGEETVLLNFTGIR